MKSTTSISLIAGLSFLCVSLGGVYWTQLNQTIQENDRNRLLRDIAITQASALERRIVRSLSATYILAQEIKRSQGEFQNFESYADTVLKSIGGISNLQLAPNGIITKIHPLIGNEKALGHNILRDDPRRQEAQLAVREKRLTLSGPFTLIQGGVAVIGRNPVFIVKEGSEQFWGFTSALIFLADLLSVTDLPELEKKGYSYQLSRPHPDTGDAEIFARSKSDLPRAHFQAQVVNVPNAQWTLSLAGPRAFSANPNVVAGYVVSFFFALGLAALVYRVLLRPEKLRLTVAEKTEQLQTLALHDQLTGLANRRLLIEKLEQEIHHLLRSESQAALLYVDLDHFKRFNDSMGHEAGDRLLQTIADRFRTALRKNDLVARLGGDEFAILLLDTDSVRHVQKTADKLIELIQQPLVLDDGEVIVSATIGIAMIPDDGQDASTLLRNADLAMYAAKKRGKRQSHFFDQKMQQIASQNLALEQDLHKALINKELLLHYQPLICLLERKIKGFEALIRWQHPTQGLLPPLQFIPVAEESGLIIPIGYWVIREACKLLKEREQEGLLPVHIAINLSPRQFADAALGSRIQEILTEFGVSPQLLELEITETTLMNDFDAAIGTLEQLRGTGISIAIDDFGTGYSSLSQLKSLPVDTIKIDRSFIDGVAADGSGDQKIVEAILAMANKLNLHVVAEGIETAAQLAFLESRQCECGQGYLFDRPFPVEQIHAHPIELQANWPTSARIDSPCAP